MSLDNLDPLARDALGVYIGPATVHEVTAAIGGHIMGEVIVFLQDANGQIVWRKIAKLELHVSGWLNFGPEDREPEHADDRYIVLVLNQLDEQTAGNPLVMIDAPLVLAFSRAAAMARPEVLRAETYSGGARLHLGFGPLNGKTLTLVFWHGILHETETGDIAPGLGPVQVRIDEV
jgi:hypothetical protein